MQNQNEGDDSCLTMGILFGFVGFVVYSFGSWVYDTWLFFHQPDVLVRTIELFQTCGMCCGIIILFFVISYIVPSRWVDFLTGFSDSGGDDDEY